jgi:hypothetical protein
VSSSAASGSHDTAGWLLKAVLLEGSQGADDIMQNKQEPNNSWLIDSRRCMHDYHDALVANQNDYTNNDESSL